MLLSILPSVLRSTRRTCRANQALIPHICTWRTMATGKGNGKKSKKDRQMGKESDTIGPSKEDLDMFLNLLDPQPPKPM